MSIPFDYIYDLTTDEKSFKHDYYDIVDTELLPKAKNEEQRQDESCESKRNFLTSKSCGKFKFTLVRKNKSTSHQFNIKKISGNEKQNYEGKRDIYIHIDLTKREANEEIDLLF